MTPDPTTSAAPAVGDQVIVVCGDRYIGQTGRVVYVQSDGSLLVDGLRGAVMEALVGWPALRPDQLRQTARSAQ
ncbi:hypothetical protein [Kitasatospora sp. GP82]|uniref:hypothetical protein n=1 Tax=Kitasatospora sp. GP82 TaxID=3035089 RepID=UPI0024761FED|nr:hypothetical protein [Kitasatospora sp. GP82]MDH6130369.1 hypothetical protein [Kitasatospora sp. GP82]